jgi:pimeloyl-ACP methyl ester carboxylesterase
LPDTSPWRRPDPLAIRGVLSLAGISDVHECARLRLDDEAAQALLGGNPDQVPDRYAIADPINLLPTGQRTLLLHGTEDPIVPPDMSLRYVEAATAHRDQSTLIVLNDVEHFGPIDPLSSSWPAVIQAIERLVSPEWTMSPC